VLIAGCSGDDSDSSSPEPTATRPDSTPTQTREPTETQTPESTAETPTEEEPDLTALERRISAFLTLQSYGFFEPAYNRLGESAAGSLSPTAIEDAWQQIISTNGQFVSVQDITFQGATDGLDVVTVDTLFQANRVTLRIALDDTGINTFEIVGGSQYTWTQPSYVDTSVFEESTVSLDAPGQCTLGGTLSVPTGEDTVPGVVIVHGSGPSDRDGTQGPNKPYKELAWGLASRGVAVLRYDKRTVACDVNPTSLTIDDVTTDDALTALQRLREHSRVAQDSTFVAGHSLGGLLAPRIATRDGSLAGAVMLAPGPARPIADVILDQQQYILSHRPLPEPQRESQITTAEQMAEQIRSLDIGEDEIVAGLAGRAYFESLAAYDGPQTAVDLSTPLFLAQGERDYQVTPDGDFAIWQEALSGQSTVELERYEGLNHLFQEGVGPSTPEEYYDPEAVFARRVIEDIVAFIERSA
jgi:pimeloyl-ACP methyl ester carboxylesterase